jgi:putative PIN family toxin of toxin-antitoxin system
VAGVRLLVDSNIIVSAIVFDGNERELIFRALEKGARLFISEHVQEGTFRALQKKFPEQSKLFYEFLALMDVRVIPRKEYMHKLDGYKMVRDTHDRHVIACAVGARCDIIVTGDKDLLVLKRVNGTMILNAKQTLGMF